MKEEIIMSNIKSAFQDVFALWDKFIDHNYFTTEELQLLTKIKGVSIKTLNDALFARYGYRDWEQMHKEDN